MKDYKARPLPKGRKPPRRSGSSPRKSRSDALPRGFTPLARPPDARPRKPSRVRQAAAAVAVGVTASRSAFRPGRLLFGAALLWLLAGLGVGAVALWRAPLLELRLDGNASVSSDAVVQLAGLTAGTPMSALDPFELTRRLATHPRLRGVDVRRIYPGRLAVTLHERQAELRVSLRDGRTAIVDAENVVLSLLDAGTVTDETLRALPIIAGVAGKPVESRPLHDAAVNRGRAALVALTELGFPHPRQVVVDGRDPFLLTLRLPGGARLIVPHDRLESSLRTYRALLERAPAALGTPGVVDLSAIAADGTGRVYLRR